MSLNSIHEHRRWKAKWIGGKGDGHENNTFLFRKTFSLEKVKSCSMFISADTRYQVRVNGVVLGSGSAQSQPFHQFYDSYEIGGNLLVGENVLAVEVNHTGRQNFSHCGLILELVDTEGHVLLCSDENWRVTLDPARQTGTQCIKTNLAFPFQEFYDARKRDDRWTSVDCDVSRWDWANVYGGRPIWSVLIARNIPHLRFSDVYAQSVEKIEESLDLKSRTRLFDLAPSLSQSGRTLEDARCENAEALLLKNGETIMAVSEKHFDLDHDGRHAPSVILDFGRIFKGNVVIELESPAGIHVDMGYAERLIDGQFNIALECDFADRIITREGQNRFETWAWRSIRYLKIRVNGGEGKVHIKNIHIKSREYPFEERGQFESEDMVLNGIFRICKETIKLCSDEAIMDTPCRESAQWLGDVALVTIPTIHSCFGDTKICDKFFAQSGANQHQTGMISNVSNVSNNHYIGAIPDYSLWWIWGLWEHYNYSGNRDLLFHLFPHACRVIQGHLPYLNEQGLIEDMPYWVFIDWADTEKKGICAAYNGIWALALEAFIKLAHAVGAGEWEREAMDSLKKVQNSFHQTLYNVNLGYYADAQIEGVLSDKISEHGNATALAAGLCPDDVADSLILRLFGEERIGGIVEAQPFYMQVVLKALDLNDNFDLALQLIRDRWGKRMLAKGATSTYEEWGQNGSWRSGGYDGFLRTNTHAWSAAPADFLIRHLAGVEILEPGCKLLKISPKKTNFDYQVTFPTPRGEINVTYKNGQSHIECPIGIELVP